MNSRIPGSDFASAIGQGFRNSPWKSIAAAGTAILLGADRFNLALHHQTKELPAYVLLVAKGGPKFKESETQGEASIDPQPNRMAVVVQRTPVSQLV